MNIEVQQERRRHQHRYDEVDLMELFKKIWHGRIIILALVVVSSILTSLFLFIIPSYYRIEATVDAVRAEQLQPMRPITLENKAYQVAASNQSIPLVFDGKEFQVPPPDEKKIYEKVLLQIGSFNNLKSFWESRIGKTLDLSVGAPETEDTKTFKKFFESFELVVLNPKAAEYTPRKIAVEYRDPKEGVLILNGYLKYVNTQVWADQIEILETAYLANLETLNTSYKSRNGIEQKKLDDEIIKLRENLKIAESLNIRETPYKELENIQLKILDSRDYLLGTKTLSQQLDILTARQGKPLSPFVSDLRAMEVWREQMTMDLARIKELKGKVQLFSVVNPPQSSIDPVKPKKILIFILVFFGSILLGVSVVLIRSALASKKLSES